MTTSDGFCRLALREKAKVCFAWKQRKQNCSDEATFQRYYSIRRTGQSIHYTPSYFNIMAVERSNENVGLAFGLVAAAAGSTAIGAAVVFFPRIVKLASRRVLAASLGFSAGVMTYVSFIEIFEKVTAALPFFRDWTTTKV